jgi:predicted MPP superfamily phosphohydrolase
VRPGRPWLQLRPPHGFQWNRITLPIAGLPPALAGYRILHLCDFHFRRSWSDAYDQIIQRTRSDPPGLILIGGDYVEDKYDHQPALPNVQRLLAGLNSRHGCFGVLGNHDGRIGRAIDGFHIKLIDRQRLLIPADGGQIELIGLPRLHPVHWMDLKFTSSLPPRVPGVPRIILSHFSHYLPHTLKAQPDLFLAGHTHGGQVCLPGGIPVLKHTPLPRRMVRGIHRVGETWLVANRGLGFSTISLRLFCPSEVVEIELQPQKTE